MVCYAIRRITLELRHQRESNKVEATMYTMNRTTTSEGLIVSSGYDNLVMPFGSEYHN